MEPKAIQLVIKCIRGVLAVHSSDHYTAHHDDDVRVHAGARGRRASVARAPARTRRRIARDGLVGLVLANQTSAATAATLDQHLHSQAVTASPTTARYSHKPARRDRFALALRDRLRTEL
eukprot:COSAG02_NODE_44119_length_368_cov_11.449814_1_plen_119_part_10